MNKAHIVIAFVMVIVLVVVIAMQLRRLHNRAARGVIGGASGSAPREHVAALAEVREPGMLSYVVDRPMANTSAKMERVGLGGAPDDSLYDDDDSTDVTGDNIATEEGESPWYEV